MGLGLDGSLGVGTDRTDSFDLDNSIWGGAGNTFIEDNARRAEIDIWVLMDNIGVDLASSVGTNFPAILVVVEFVLSWCETVASGVGDRDCFNICLVGEQERFGLFYGPGGLDHFGAVIPECLFLLVLLFGDNGDSFGIHGIVVVVCNSGCLVITDKWCCAYEGDLLWEWCCIDCSEGGDGWCSYSAVDEWIGNNRQGITSSQMFSLGINIDILNRSWASVNGIDNNILVGQIDHIFNISNILDYLSSIVDGFCGSLGLVYIIGIFLICYGFGHLVVGLHLHIAVIHSYLLVLGGFCDDDGLAWGYRHDWHWHWHWLYYHCWFFYVYVWLGWGGGIRNWYDGWDWGPYIDRWDYGHRRGGWEYIILYIVLHFVIRQDGPVSVFPDILNNNLLLLEAASLAMAATAKSN